MLSATFPWVFWNPIGLFTSVTVTVFFACAACFAGPLAWARVSPSSMTPLVGTNYKPVDDDERGIIREAVKIERLGAVLGELQ